MNRFLSLIAISAVLGATAAHAKENVQENTPLSGGKAQAHSEEHKQQRKAKPAQAAGMSATGETGRGAGSGVVTPNAPERAGQAAAAQREAKPHKETTQGGNPK